MGKIVLIASGDVNALDANNLKITANDPELEVYNATLSSASDLIRDLNLERDDILLSRRDIIDLLHVDLTCQYSEIEIHDRDILDAIHRARMTCDKLDPIIAYVGVEKYLKSAFSLLREISLALRMYPCQCISDVEKNVKRAIREGADVVICGAYATRFANAARIPFSILCTNGETLKECYDRAVALRDAMEVEHQRNERRNTILNAATEGLIGVDADLTVEIFNVPAQEAFGVGWSDRGAQVSLPQLVPSQVVEICRGVISTGKRLIGKILELGGKNYALSFQPVIDMDKILGVTIVLQEQETLAKLETKMRRSSTWRGNVARYDFKDIKGRSPQLLRTIEMARDFAAVDSNVLIYGQTGTGKEMFAQSMHNASRRREGPFVAVNCGAIPSTLIESEFFGYVDGAFTGAQKGGKIGYFEQAHNGTLFLDEVSELDIPAQIALLRVIQERCVRRVGSDVITPVNTRIIAASNTNLIKRIGNNLFRQDLYYRLCVLMLPIPDLNNRPGDAELLAKEFFREYSATFHKKLTVLPEAMQLLSEQCWDGNIRQLRNFCERLTAITHTPTIDRQLMETELISCSHFETEGQTLHKPCRASSKEQVVVKGRVITAAEVEKLMQENFGNRVKVANALNISKTTLWKLLKKMSLV
ncbi:MAG: sigma-54 interaction domain-containing protein [Oscillospiraceae bacterium]